MHGQTMSIEPPMPAHRQCDQKKIAKCLKKDPARLISLEKMIDFDTFTKIA